MMNDDRRTPGQEKGKVGEGEDAVGQKPAGQGSGEDIQVVPAGDTVEFEAVTGPADEAPPPKKKASAEAAVPAAELEEAKGLKHKIKKRDAELKALRKEGEGLKKENEELKDKYLRTLADMENLRKRHEREMADYRQYALSGLLKEMLVVVDNFERALAAGDEADGKAFQEGVGMIYRQLVELLRKAGVVPILMQDKKFDPVHQQAVMTEESDDVLEAEVAEEMQRGYLLHGRLLRPAMVKVRIPKKG